MALDRTCSIKKYKKREEGRWSRSTKLNTEKLNTVKNTNTNVEMLINELTTFFRIQKPKMAVQGSSVQYFYTVLFLLLIMD
jgi:hypothetical protein